MNKLATNVLLIALTAVSCGVYLADSFVQKTSATTEAVQFSNDTFTSTPPEPLPVIDEPQPSPVLDVTALAGAVPIVIDPPEVKPEVKTQPSNVVCSGGVCSVRSESSGGSYRRFRIFRRR